MNFHTFPTDLLDIIQDFLPNKYDKHMKEYREEKAANKIIQNFMNCARCDDKLGVCGPEYHRVNFLGDEVLLGVNCLDDMLCCYDCDEYIDMGNDDVLICDICSDSACRECRKWIKLDNEDSSIICDNCFGEI